MSKDVFDIYRRAMADLWGPNYWVTWRPGTRLRLGDVGVVSNGEFEQVTDAAALGLEFKTRRESAREQLGYQTSGQVEVTFKAAGATPAGFAALGRADAGALIRFGREDALLVSLDDVREARIDDMARVARAIVVAYAKGRWEAKYLLVTSLVTARSGTVVMSGGAESRLELRATAAVGSGPVTLGDLSAGMAVASVSRVGLQLVSEGGLTPFFRVFRLRSSWLGRVTEEFGAPQSAKGGRPAEGALAAAAGSLGAGAADEPDAAVEELLQEDTLE